MFPNVRWIDACSMISPGPPVTRDVVLSCSNAEHPGSNDGRLPARPNARCCVRVDASNPAHFDELKCDGHFHWLVLSSLALLALDFELLPDRSQLTGHLGIEIVFDRSSP